MDHLETVIHLNNAINQGIVKKIISLIDKKTTEKLTTVGGLNTSQRNVKGYNLKMGQNKMKPTDIFYGNIIKSEIERLFVFYRAKFPLVKTNKIDQIDLLKYTSGGHYIPHVDYATGSTRYMSVIINLNNDYEGGDLIFTDQKENEIKRLKLDTGSIVFFPSNFMYPHSIQPVTKGTRYSIVAWLQ